MSAKGFLIGCACYVVIGILYFLLAGGGRGGDMPFGAEILVWPVLMFPLGVVGLVAPALDAKLGSLANDTFGSYRSLEWFVMFGNLLLWGFAGGFIGRLLRRKVS